MRIAYLVHNYPPHGVAGTEVYTWSLANAMARRGHDVWVFRPEESAQRQVDEYGVRHWVAARGDRQIMPQPLLAFWHLYRNGAIERAWAQFLAQTRPDIVHVQHLQNVSTQLPAMTDAPLVATLHDYWYLCASGQFLRPDHSICATPGIARRCADCGLARAGLPSAAPLTALATMPFAMRNRAARRALDQMDHLISPSAFLRQKYMAQGVSGASFQVIENGLDLSRLGVDEAPAPGLSPGLRLMFLGSIAWQKGVHTLIKAFNHVHHQDARLTIYGNLATFAQYAADVQTSARHPGITFAGALDHRHVGQAMRQADYLVVPSLWFENSPVVIQEAYAVGLPVIASDLGALPEKVVDGVTGRLFAPGDPQSLARLIDELAAKPQLRETYQANIRPCPDIDTHAQKIEEIYNRLVS